MVSLQSLNFATEAATDNKQMARHGCVPNILLTKKALGQIWPMGHSLPIHGLEYRGYPIQKDPFSDLL